MARESERNARLGIPSGTMAETTLKMHKELGGLPLNEEMAMSLFLKTSCTSNLTKDNPSNCDFGRESNNNLSLRKIKY